MSSFHFCLSAAKNLCSFQLLPASLMTDLLQLFLGLPLFLLPWGFHSRAALDISPSSFLNVWIIHLNFLFLISRFISSWSVTLHKSLLEIMFGHHNLKMYLRRRLTKTCILRRISVVTSHVSHPYKSTDFTQALKILILISFRFDVDSHTFLSLDKDPLAFCILTLTSVLAPPSSATTLYIYIYIYIYVCVCVCVCVCVYKHKNWNYKDSKINYDKYTLGYLENILFLLFSSVFCWVI